MRDNPPYSVAAALLVAACGGSGPQTTPERVQGRITGHATLEGVAAGAALSAKDGAPDSDTIFAQSSADAQGDFSLELGPLYGPMVLEVETTSGARLSTRVVLEQGETRANVQVSPVTTLALAWARGAERRGLDGDAAWARGTELLFGHLGHVDHSAAVPVDLRTQTGVTVDDGVRAGLILHGLAEQALRFGRRSEGQGAAAVTVGSLVEAYARDLEDGLADGRDRFGAPVTVGAVRLTPDSLRLDLSMALAAFLDGARNGSTLRSTHVRDLLRSLREAEGPLFPEGSLAERDQVGPELTLTWRQGGVPLMSGAPVTGAVELEVVAEDPSGVAQLEGRVVSELEVVLGAETWTDRATWVLDTISLGDGAHLVEVRAVDGLEFVETATTIVVVDHTAPTIALEGPAQVDTPTVALSGSWFDGSGVEQVELRVDGESRLVLMQPEPRFEVTLSLGCRGGETGTVEAVATDAAGNASAAAVHEVVCVGTAPTLVLLPSSTVDERSLVFQHGPDGALVGVHTPPSPPSVVLDAGAVWPVRLFKLFSQLDASSPNLPTFRWRASGAGLLRASYRTLVDGAVQRDWSPLEVGIGGRVDLPVSYATFGAELVTRGRDAVHAAEVEVTDGQGGRVVRSVSFQLDVLSPPVWVGGCRQTLTPASLRLGFSAGADTEVVAARARWDLGLDAGSQAPSAPVRLSWSVTTVGSEIAALGEEKWSASSFAPEPLGRRCDPGWNTQGDAVFHNIYSGPGQGVCAWGAYPTETLDAFLPGRDGRLSQLASAAGRFELLLGSVPVVADGQGRVELEAGQGYDVGLVAEQPGLRLPDGGPYTWPTAIDVPAGYASAVQAQGRARYPVQAFERSGADHQDRVLEGRPFVTRAFVQRVHVGIPALGAVADIPLLGIEVPVTFDAACSVPQLLEVQL